VIEEGIPTFCIFLSKGKFQVRGAEPEIVYLVILHDWDTFLP